MLQENGRGAVTIDIQNPREASYFIQTGDQLYIKVYSLDPKTSKFFQTDLPNLMNPTYLYLNSYTVDSEGYIGFSFVDRLHVQGLNLEQAQKKIQDVLNEYFVETTSVVKLVNFQVSVLGEVHNPGTFTINREYVNLLQALSLAGGTTEFANINRLKLIRQTATGSQVYLVDLSKIELLSSDQFHLVPNDMLYLEPRNVKTYSSRAFPYSIVLSAISTAILIYTVIK